MHRTEQCFFEDRSIGNARHLALVTGSSVRKFGQAIAPHKGGGGSLVRGIEYHAATITAKCHRLFAAL
jgi:hypothetical protein